MTEAPSDTPPPLLRDKDFNAPSVFRPENLMRAARRQKGLAPSALPGTCLLDPDGDIVRWLVRTDRAVRHKDWACYHTQLYTFTWDNQVFGIIGNAVGASFAVLLAEQLFASGTELLISMTSAGQIAPKMNLPCFVLIDRALRDEGTSYHYLPSKDYVQANSELIARLEHAFDSLPFPVLQGAAWTTDAPYRETKIAIAARREAGILAAEMESAALYAFSSARQQPVVCLAHVTNQMAQGDEDFEKGARDGAKVALDVIAAVARTLTHAPGTQDEK